MKLTSAHLVSSHPDFELERLLGVDSIKRNCPKFLKLLNKIRQTTLAI